MSDYAAGLRAQLDRARHRVVRVRAALSRFEAAADPSDPKQMRLLERLAHDLRQAELDCGWTERSS